MGGAKRGPKKHSAAAVVSEHPHPHHQHKDAAAASAAKGPEARLRAAIRVAFESAVRANVRGGGVFRVEQLGGDLLFEAASGDALRGVAMTPGHQFEVASVTKVGPKPVFFSLEYRTPARLQ